MSEPILLVDDEPNLLSGLERILRRRFSVETAKNGADALALIGQGRTYALVISDMRMPGMSGIELLRKIREIAPDTVRIMLTGHADQDSAIEAINQGSIFRFLTKPCPTEMLEQSVESALEQYRLITAEKELLERTLAGSVKVLVDILTIYDPSGFGRAGMVRDWIRLLIKAGKAPAHWRLDLAAMLLPLGLVAVPPQVLAKCRAGIPLTAEEREFFARSPEIAQALVANIPRLGKVAEIIALQGRGFDGSGFPADGPVGADIPEESRLLKILNDLSWHCRTPRPTAKDFAMLEPDRAAYDPDMLAAVRAVLEVRENENRDAGRTMLLTVSQLQPGMVLTESLRLANGNLMLPAGTLLSPSLNDALRVLARIHRFQEPVRVAT